MSRGRDKRIQGTNTVDDGNRTSTGMGRRNVIFHLKILVPEPICSGIKSCGMAGAGAGDGVLRMLLPLKMYHNLSDEGPYLGCKKYNLFAHTTRQHYNGMCKIRKYLDLARRCQCETTK